jgi:hypothetical protein
VHAVPLTWFAAGLVLALVVAFVKEVRRKPTGAGGMGDVIYKLSIFVALWLGLGAWSGKSLSDGLPGLAALLTFYFLVLLVRMARWPW